MTSSTLDTWSEAADEVSNGKSHRDSVPLLSLSDDETLCSCGEQNVSLSTKFYTLYYLIHE
jgi:hypothetical protein